MTRSAWLALAATAALGGAVYSQSGPNSLQIAGPFYALVGQAGAYDITAPPGLYQVPGHATVNGVSSAVIVSITVPSPTPGPNPPPGPGPSPPPNPPPNPPPPPPPPPPVNLPCAAVTPVAPPSTTGLVGNLDPAHPFKRRGRGYVRPENIQQLMLGHAPQAAHTLGARGLASPDPTAKKFSWCAPGSGLPAVIGPPLDQGQCGSCWDFATAGTFSAAFALANGGAIQVPSTQQILDCDNSNGGCGGGNAAFQFIQDHGSTCDNLYPYLAHGAACHNPSTNPLRALSWGYVNPDSNSIPTVAELKKALCQYGPLCVAVQANGAFENYSGGMFTGFSGNNPNNTNHMVMITGWDDNIGGAWEIRNSWSAQWGINGFMFIKYDTNNIGSDASYVVAAKLSSLNEPGQTPMPSPQSWLVKPGQRLDLAYDIIVDLEPVK